MNAKQKRFCDEYLIDCNATQAAVRAGYSSKTAKQIGQRILTYVDVQTYINEQLAKLHSEKTADAQEIMEYLTAVMRGEEKEEIPILCGDGKQRIIKKELDTKERLKAAELLGKRFGMFTDKLQVDSRTVVIIDDILDGEPNG